MTRIIEVPLPEELLQAVDEKAQNAGLNRDAYIRAILSKDVTGEPSIGEILSSFRAEVSRSGISDEELDRVFLDSREEAHRKQNPG